MRRPGCCCSLGSRAAQVYWLAKCHTHLASAIWHKRQSTQPHAHPQHTATLPNRTSLISQTPQYPIISLVDMRQPYTLTTPNPNPTPNKGRRRNGTRRTRTRVDRSAALTLTRRRAGRDARRGWLAHRSEAVLLTPSTLPVDDAMDYVSDNFGKMPMSSVRWSMEVPSVRLFCPRTVSGTG